MCPSRLAALRRLRDDTGRGGPEYAGAAAVLAIIVVSLIFSGLGEAIISAILDAIGEGLRGGGRSDSVELARVVAGGLVGVLAGALLNAVVHRIPQGVTVSWPPPSPGFRLALLAVLLSPARRGAGAHAAVELLMGAVFAAVSARIGWDWALPAFLLFAWTVVCSAIIDASTHKIPNRLTYPLTPTLAVLLVAAALLAGEPGWALRALAGGVLAFATLLALALFRPGSMGMGDVKLAGFIGLALGYLGWSHVLLGLASAFLIGGVVAFVLIGLRERSRRDLLPFGPYLAAGALLSVVLGGPLLSGYAALVMP